MVPIKNLDLSLSNLFTSDASRDTATFPDWLLLFFKGDLSSVIFLPISSLASFKYFFFYAEFLLETWLI